MLLIMLLKYETLYWKSPCSSDQWKSFESCGCVIKGLATVLDYKTVDFLPAPPLSNLYVMLLYIVSNALHILERTK
jgi:hypothetical protein